MDYGVMLKKNLPNPSRKSAHHTQQSKFEGSHRQVRGMILKALLERPFIAMPEFELLLQKELSVISKALQELTAEGFIILHGDNVALR
jgi:A/G-specific adenine glycosylase